MASVSLQRYFPPFPSRKMCILIIIVGRSPNIIRNLRKTDDERGAEYEMAEDTRKGYQRVQSREV